MPYINLTFAQQEELKMKTTFIHTADWQIGKPFNSISDAYKRSLLQDSRIRNIEKMGAIITEYGVDFMIVAGDIFDAPHPTKSTVSAVCAAIAKLQIPVYMIPGNHDYAGPGSLWEQPFFKTIQPKNLFLLDKFEPIETPHAILFPCPLLRRHETNDLCAWLQTNETANKPHEKPKIGIAHGSVHGFMSVQDDDEYAITQHNLLGVDKLNLNLFDYIALGDWHGVKQLNEKTWYAGTHEQDRFNKNDQHQLGQILLVEINENKQNNVQIIPTNEIHWHELSFHFQHENDIELFEQKINNLLPNRANKDLLKLNLQGSLGLKDLTKLHLLVEQLEARLIRIKLHNEVVISPTESEIWSLQSRPQDPLISSVAKALWEIMQQNTAQSTTAGLALKELYLSVNP